MTIEPTPSEFRLKCDVCGLESSPFPTLLSAQRTGTQLGWKGKLREIMATGAWHYYYACPKCKLPEQP